MKSTHTRKPLQQQAPEQSEHSFFSKTQDDVKRKDDVFFQTKLAVGEKDDKHEKEADAVAGKVQKKAEEDKNKEAAQNKQEEKKEPVQKMDKKEDDKTKVNKKDEEKKEPEVQKADKPEEEKPVQKMSDNEKKDDKSAVQKKDGGGKEKDEPVMFAKATGGPAPVAHKLSVEERIKQNKGKGNPLPDDVRRNMENELGADFSMVVVHTGSEATLLNKELNSIAFTNGFDIFFNEGQYQPYTIPGQKLLAHELTHVIQQTGVSKKKEEKKK